MLSQALDVQVANNDLIKLSFVSVKAYMYILVVKPKVLMMIES